MSERGGAKLIGGQPPKIRIVCDTKRIARQRITEIGGRAIPNHSQRGIGRFCWQFEGWQWCVGWRWQNFSWAWFDCSCFC